jgi:hypothetical protein
MRSVFDALDGVRKLRGELGRRGVAGDLDGRLAELEGERPVRSRRGSGGEAAALVPSQARLLDVYEQLQAADAEPTVQLARAARAAVAGSAKLVARWKELQTAAR